MDDFFNDDPLEHPLDARLKEALARLSPPLGYEGHLITEIGPYLVWKLPSEMGPDDPIVFFDGDCRDVLKRDDPKVIRYLNWRARSA
jgi:hypothetical protein